MQQSAETIFQLDRRASTLTDDDPAVETSGPGRVAVPVSGASDAALLAILDAPLAPGETALAGFRRKEHALGNAFAALSIIEARALHLRLANPRAADALATRFARLTIERKNRLLTFLADARRRAALAGR